MGLALSRLSSFFSRDQDRERARGEEEEAEEMELRPRKRQRQTKREDDQGEIMELRPRKRRQQQPQRQTKTAAKRGAEAVAASPMTAPVQRSAQRQRTISSCTSPRSAFLTRHSEFNWYEEDVWTEVAKYLDGRDLVRMGTTNRWFHRLMNEQCIWKYACLRDLQVPPPRHVSFPWTHLYSSAFNGSHSYGFRQQEKHIDWMRIGAFFFDSPVALLTESLRLPRRLPKIEDDAEKCIQTSGVCLLTNIRTGIWIADLQLVRCPVCNLNTCEGTMQVLDARHVELFLEEGYKSGIWEYSDIGSRKIDKSSAAATGVIMDPKHHNLCGDLLNGKSWVGQPNDWQPKARLCLHAVAVNTNLQPNEGLNVKFQAMRSDGAEGKVVSIRISQQLI